MKQILGTILMPALLLMVACDPGMTIRQTRSASEATSAVAAHREKPFRPPEVLSVRSVGVPEAGNVGQAPKLDWGTDPAAFASQRLVGAR
jgi:hypothetical protein